MIVVSQFVQSMLGDNPDNPEVIIEFFNQRAVEFTSRVSINSFNKLTRRIRIAASTNILLWAMKRGPP